MKVKGETWSDLALDDTWEAHAHHRQAEFFVSREVPRCLQFKAKY